MAFLACDCHSSPFRGKSQYVYPALVANGQRTTDRKRLCPVGAEHFQTLFGKHFEEQSDGLYTLAKESASCAWCGDTDKSKLVGSVYVTSYLGAGERRDFQAFVCNDCRGQAAQDVLLDAS